MNFPSLNLADDGLDQSPRDTALLLARLAAESGAERDAYGKGDVVAKFEERLAACVGKERAIVMPTGTLANVLALELHATRAARRVVVQQDGHIMGDTGDSAARLAGVTLVPLQDRGAGFSAAALEAAVARAANGRVATPIAAVVIETPVRSRHAQLFERDDFDAVVAAAKAAGLRLHLDAARLFIAAAWYGRTPADLCAPFDTVYVSLYKQLATPFGAALAGPAALIDGLADARRRSGGGLAQFWPAALLANHHLDGVAERWTRVVAMAPAVWEALAASGRFQIARRADESNIVGLTLREGADSAAFRARATAAQVRLPPEEAGMLWIRANETWLRSSAEEIAARLIAAAE
jgi:threonine aldolase